VIHTPGHTPGHVSLWPDSDRVLLAGDAIIATRQESALSVVRQTPELHGPPAYFTPDWFAAGTSVRVLGELYPDIILAGHGQPVRGDRMRLMLRQLAEGFEAIAVPAHRIPRTVIVS
jgi:glyoxylase-like metal-dependent hydrolase (beta-lactamase superfamily II)